MTDRTYEELAEQAAVKAAAGRAGAVSPFEVTQTEYETILGYTQEATKVFYGAKLKVIPSRFRLKS